MARTLEELATTLTNDPEFNALGQAEQDRVFGELAKDIEPPGSSNAASSASSAPFLPFAGTSVGAIGQSGKEYAGNIGQAIMHPIQTIQGIGNIGLGVAQKLIPGQQPQEPYADAVGDFVKQRYGSFEALKETWKRDPVGVAADAATILTAGGGAVTKIGTANQLSKVAKLGRISSVAGQALDPLALTLRAASGPARLAGRGMEKTSGQMINSLIKPTNRQFAFGKNPGAAIAKAGIVASSLEDLEVKLGQRVNQLGQQIGAVLDNPQIASKTFNMTDAFTPIDDALIVAKKNPRTNAAVIQRLENLRDDLLGVTVNADGTTAVTRDFTAMSPKDAFGVKQAVSDLTKWTENLSDDTMVDRALKKTYAKIRSKIEQAAPGIHPLNEQYANLLEGQRATRNQIYVAQRRNQFGALDVIAGIGGGVSGGLGTGVVGVLLSQGAKAAMRSPYIRTEFAKWINRASPTEVNAFFQRVPGLQSEATRAGLLVGTAYQRINDPQSSSQTR